MAAGQVNDPQLTNSPAVAAPSVTLPYPPGRSDAKHHR